MAGKILIADDEPHIRRLIEQSLEELEDEGVKIIAVATGEAALEAVRVDRPELVILDVMMPVMNGFDVCASIKKDETMKPAFVILLTAKGQEYDRRRGETAGADRYMTKPFDPDQLLAVAREVLNLPAG